MVWTAEKRERSNDLVVVVCVDCKVELEVRKRMVSRQKRCADCQHERELRMQREYQQEYERWQPVGLVGRFGPREGDGLRVVVDPCSSWGRESVLTFTEVRELLKLGFLEVGTVFEAEGSGERLEVMQEVKAGRDGRERVKLVLRSLKH